MHLDGREVSGQPLIDRKALLEPLVADKPGLQFNGHETGDGELILKHAGKLGFEGVVSKTIDAPYITRRETMAYRFEAASQLGKNLHGHPRAHAAGLDERAVVGVVAQQQHPEMRPRSFRVRPADDDERLAVQPFGFALARKTSPLSVPPPRKTRFGSPLVLSRVHWVEPQLVAEITYLAWTADNLLRHTVYVGLREDKPAMDVRREAARVR